MLRLCIFLVFCLTLIVAPTPSRGSDAKLKGGPYQVESLGTIMKAATLEHRLMIREPKTRQPHLLLFYWPLKHWQQIFQILDLNLETSQIRVVDGVLGRPGPGATFLHSNGKVYIGTGDPCCLMSYDPASGRTQELGKLADKVAQFAVEGEDGAVYLGECVKGYVERYDPKTGAWQNYGIMDDPGPPYYRYAFTLGADQRYLYVGMGMMHWYLVVYDLVDKTQKVYWKGEKADRIMIRKGPGGWYACRTIGADRQEWYQLKGPEPPKLLPKPPAIYPLDRQIATDV